MKDLTNRCDGSGLGAKVVSTPHGAALPSLRYARALLPPLFPPYLGGLTLFSFPFGRLVHYSTAVRLSIKAVSVTELGQGHG